MFSKPSSTLLTLKLKLVGEVFKPNGSTEN